MVYFSKKSSPCARFLISWFETAVAVRRNIFVDQNENSYGDALFFKTIHKYMIFDLIKLKTKYLKTSCTIFQSLITELLYCKNNFADKLINNTFYCNILMKAFEKRKFEVTNTVQQYLHCNVNETNSFSYLYVVSKKCINILSSNVWIIKLMIPRKETKYSL